MIFTASQLCWKHLMGTLLHLLQPQTRPLYLKFQLMCVYKKKMLMIIIFFSPANRPKTDFRIRRTELTMNLSAAETPSMLTPGFKSTALSWTLALNKLLQRNPTLTPGFKITTTKTPYMLTPGFKLTATETPSMSTPGFKSTATETHSMLTPWL